MEAQRQRDTRRDRWGKERDTQRQREGKKTVRNGDEEIWRERNRQKG